MIAANLRCMKCGFGILSGVLVQCAAAFLLSASLSAQTPNSGVRTLSATSWVEEWDPAAQRWVKVADRAPSGLLYTAPVAAATTAVTTTRMVQRTAGGQAIITTQTIAFALPEPAGTAGGWNRATLPQMRRKTGSISTITKKWAWRPIVRGRFTR